MTTQAYLKILKKKLANRKSKRAELQKRNYRPNSYKDYNAFYIQEEIKFIEGVIKEYENTIEFQKKYPHAY